MLPCFLQEGEPITPTGEPLNENLEPLKQDDVDTSNRPGQDPDSVVDKIPNSTVTQSEWHGRHTEENTKSKTFKETHNLKSGRIWCIGTQNVENGYKRAFFARLGEGLKKY